MGIGPLVGLGRMGVRVFFIVGEFRPALIDPFAQFGDQEGNISGDLRLPGGFKSRGRELPLFCTQIEPGGADLGAVERDQRVSPFDLLFEDNMNLAHDAGGAGTDLDLAVRVGLDDADYPDLRPDPVESRRARSRSWPP